MAKGLNEVIRDAQSRTGGSQKDDFLLHQDKLSFDDSKSRTVAKKLGGEIPSSSQPVASAGVIQDSKQQFQRALEQAKRENSVQEFAYFAIPKIQEALKKTSSATAHMIHDQHKGSVTTPTQTNAAEQTVTIAPTMRSKS